MQCTSCNRQQESSQPPADSALQKQKTVLISLCADIGLWIPEIIAVILSGSVTMFADVLKCGNEILATFFALLILIKMKRCGSFTYDYGMGKFETLTRIVTGGVMLVSIFIIFTSAFTRIFAPEELNPAGAIIGIPLMLITATVDTYLWQKNYRISKNDPSPIMESQWRLRRAKAFADIAVLLSLVISFALAGAGFWFAVYVDPGVSFIIIGFLLLAGFREISTSLPDLFDKTLEEELQIVILQELSEFFDEYKEFYGVRSRRSGSRIYIEIFLGFDADRPMGEVQEVSDRFKFALENKITGSTVSIVPTSERSAKSGRI